MTARLGNISIKEFREFLKYHDLNFLRIKSGHEIWSKKTLTRPVTFQTHIDPIPTFIISNNLRTMGLTSTDLRSFLSQRKGNQK
jgi:hypothetical protein